jgi:hypothetical protein
MTFCSEEFHDIQTHGSHPQAKGPMPTLLQTVCPCSLSIQLCFGDVLILLNSNSH